MEKKKKDKKEKQNKIKWNKTKTEKNKGVKNFRERVKAKWFCYGFKLGFFQLICKDSLILNQI